MWVPESDRPGFRVLSPDSCLLTPSVSFLVQWDQCSPGVAVRTRCDHASQSVNNSANLQHPWAYTVATARLCADLFRCHFLGKRPRKAALTRQASVHAEGEASNLYYPLCGVTLVGVHWCPTCVLGGLLGRSQGR